MSNVHCSVTQRQGNNKRYSYFKTQAKACGYQLAQNLAMTTNDFEVQRMCAADVPALMDAFVVAWHKPLDQYPRYWAENESGTRITLIAWVDGQLAGYGNLLWRSDYAPFIEADIPEINDLNTLEPFRQRGIASAIIRECERIAAEHGKPIMGIGVGKTPDYGNAQRLYPKLGYEYDGRGVITTIWGDEEYLTKRIL
jgi:GNAT superfamily N-acetyltransferase